MEKQKRKEARAERNKSNYFVRHWELYLMIAIPFVIFFIFKYMPMFGNVLAFRRYKPGGSSFGSEWVGLHYFQRFFKDVRFWSALKNTLVLSILNLAINFPMPIIFALLLNELQGKMFKKVVQTVSYMPRFISTVVVIAILNEMLSPSSGVINLFLQKNFGMDAIYFMNEAQYFRPIYILTEMWQFTGWNAIIYLAAITNVDAELFEAAEIDGANRWKQIWYVTIPSILPTVMTMLILQVGRLLTVGFEKVLLLYTPANSGVSDILDTLIYRTGLVSQNYSLATAMGLFMGIVGLILVSSANGISKKVTGSSVY